MKLVLTAEVETPTKNFYKYAIVTKEGRVGTFGTIYVAKNEAGAQPPARVTVTVESA